MSSAHLQSVQIAAEVSPGSFDADGIPDASALFPGLAVSAPLLRQAAYAAPGEPELTERSDARDGPHMHPADYGTTRGGTGANIHRRPNAVVSMAMPVENIGTGGPIFDHNDTPLGKILRSSMSAPAIPGIATDAAGANVGANEFTPGLFGNYRVGQLIQVMKGASQAEYTAVTDIPGNVIHSPAMSAGIGAETVNILRTFCVDNRFARGPAIAALLDGHTFRNYGVMGRLQQLKIAANGRRVDATCQVRFGGTYPDHSDPAVGGGTNFVEPVRLAGGVVNALGARSIRSAVSVQGVTAPAQHGGTQLFVDEFDFTLDWTLRESGTGADNNLGFTDLEAVDDALRDGDQYSIILAFAGGGGGRGACIHIPAATMRGDASQRDGSGDIVRYSVSFGAGRWSGDNATADEAGTICRIGLAA